MSVVDDKDGGGVTAVADVTEVTPLIHNPEPKTVFDREKHTRARLHLSNLEDIQKGDPFRRFRRSWLTPFFGSNEPERLLEIERHVHPCQLYSEEVHQCLDKQNNNYLFCQSIVADLQRCLREFKM